MIEVNDDILLSILKQQCRIIVHMRQEIEYNRFGLILGAGIGYNLGFPNWLELIKRIAAHKDVQAEDLLIKESKSGETEKFKRSNTSISQLLFFRFKENELEDAAKDNRSNTYNRFEQETNVKWLRIVHACLYRDVPEDILELKSRDTYLQNFIELIKKTNITINYNFDDSIEKLVRDSLTEVEKDQKRGYKTSWSANVKLYPQSNVIYHPNGYLPQKITEYPSPNIIFLEDSFADQLIDSVSGHYSFLMNHLTQHTCLLLGLSLEDPTLKHLLRQNAKRHPGHHHYYVSYINPGEQLSEDYKKSVFISNFEVYNLITLFLTSEEIAAFGILLSNNKQDFKDLVQTHRKEGLHNVYRYFLTGPVGVGKSTMKNQFKCFGTIDEWFDDLPEGMEKDPSFVSKEEIDRIDKWIAEQIYLKNRKLEEDNSGIYVIDRALLDPFAFTEIDKWQEKAKILNKELKNPGHETSLVAGHVILLIGDPEIMAIRALVEFRKTNAEKLNKQQEWLKQIYPKGKKGISIIDIREKSISQVTKEIAKIIYCHEYDIAPMQIWLEKIENGEKHAED